MKGKIAQSIRYIKHFFTAKNTGGHGVHSPYVYRFIQYVLLEKHPFYLFPKIENYRKLLKKDHKELFITDYGSGQSKFRKISEIAGKSAQKPKYAQILFRITQFLEAKWTLELGTSLGITTMYIAGGSSNSECITLEGCPALSAFSAEKFNQYEFNNISIIEGNIDSTLPGLLNEKAHFDLIYIDANHKYEPLMRYFEICSNKISKNGIIVLDDINWSNEMNEAWQEIKEHPKVSSTIDIYKLGIVFFNPTLNKQNYKLVV